MLDSVPVSLLVGTVLGFLSGLGIGGGSLLVLWMTLVLSVPQEAARTVNLLFFLPSAAAAICFRIKQGSVPLGKLLPAIAAGCCSAALAALLFGSADTGLLRKGFGILLLAAGIRELLYRPKQPPFTAS